MKKNNYPKFVKLVTNEKTKEGTLLKLVQSNYRGIGNRGLAYYRDAGIWYVGFKEVEGKLISVSNVDVVDNKELIEVTEAEYKKDNKGYL